jgi:hypothetical protein
MAMVLYHATSMNYSVGQKLGALEEASFWNRHERSPELAQLEREFERLRPRDAPPRRIARFAFSSIGQCLWYLEKADTEPGRRDAGTVPRRIYQVEASHSCRAAPMKLVDLARKHLGDEMLVESIISEYWIQTEQWKVLEFLCEDLVVVGEIALSEVERINLVQVAGLDSIDDVHLSWKKWPDTR